MKAKTNTNLRSANKNRALPTAGVSNEPPPPTANPTTHLTLSENGWALIHQGQPLTHNSASFADCLAVASRQKLRLSALIWVASEGKFETLSRAKHFVNSNHK